MKKASSNFVCQQCGYRSPKWLGRCPSCGQWNSLVEEIISYDKKRKKPALSAPVALSSLSLQDRERILTEIKEIDQILGGGLVPGALILLGGDPGIGKSTLLLQISYQLVYKGLRVLYVSAEESLAQIKLRADRLDISHDNLFLLAETNLENILEAAEKLNPQVLILDSIQTVYLTEIGSAPGSVSQVRECTGRVMSWAKSRDTIVFLVGHVTKEGAIAGPRVLEHLVDTVLYFEGERNTFFRILRSVKNRFGPTNEFALLEMSYKGLRAVDNPSAWFLSQGSLSSPGSVVTSTIEGSRPVLVEVQALVTNTSLAVPRRTCVGFDPQRLSMLAAILEKRIGLNFYNRDIYLNVVGGLKLVEPGVDLAISLSLVSSYMDKPLSSKTVVFGEVGLTGEIRPVPQGEVRLKEAERLGFEKAYIPEGNLKTLRDKFSLILIDVSNLQEAIEMAF